MKNSVVHAALLIVAVVAIVGSPASAIDEGESAVLKLKAVNCPLPTTLFSAAVTVTILKDNGDPPVVLPTEYTNPFGRVDITVYPIMPGDVVSIELLPQGESTHNTFAVHYKDPCPTCNDDDDEDVWDLWPNSAPGGGGGGCNATQGSDGVITLPYDG